MQNKSSKWLPIALISGALLAFVCCLAMGAFWFFGRAQNNLTDVKRPVVRSLAWSPDGSKLAVGSADHSLTIWDVKSARLLLSINKHNWSVRELAWSPDGALLAAGDEGGVVCLWNPLTGELVEQVTQEHEQDALGFLDWSPDGQFLAYAGGQGNILGWDVIRRQKTVFAQVKGGLTGIAWSPDDARLATSSTDGTVTIWDRQTDKSNWVIAAHQDWANDVDWSPDGTLLASGGDDARLNIWDAKTGKLVRQFSGSNRVFSVAWSPKDASRIAWQSNLGEVTITSLDGSDRQLKAGSGKVWVVAWSPDGAQLAAGTDTNTVFIWDAATGQEIQLLTLP